MKILRLALTLLFVITGVVVAQAQYLFQEDFSQTSGSVLSWPTDCGSGTNITISPIGLTYPGYVGSGTGNAANIIGSGGSGSSHSMSFSNFSTPVYVGFLVNVQSAASFSSPGGCAPGTDVILAFDPNSGGSSNDHGLILQPNGVGFQFGLHTDFGDSFSPVVYSLNTTYLIVMKRGFGSLLLYVNPTLGGTEPAPDVTSSFSTGSGNAANGLSMSNRGLSNLILDGIRVSNNWSDIVFTAPSLQAFNLTFSNQTTTTVQLNWVIGNGSSRIVVAKAGTPVDGFPVDGTTYNANSFFGSGSLIGTGNYVVASSGNFATISNLNPGTVYYFQVFELNSNGSTNMYNTTSATNNPNSTFTLFPEPTSQAFNYSFSAVTDVSMLVSWVNGNGTERAVVASKNGGIAFVPVDGVSYTGNSNYSLAPEINAGSENRVVYRGSGSSVFLTGLQAGTNYAIGVFELNGTGTATNYLTIGNVSTVYTLSTEPSTQPGTLTATSSSPTQITLSFPAPNTIPNTTGYLILRRSDGINPDATGIVDGADPFSQGLPGTTTLIATAGLATTTYSDLAVSPKTKYNYAIIPFNTSGPAQTYNYRTAATIATANVYSLATEPTAQASVFTATTAGTNQISLNFSPASSIPNAAGYILLRRQDGTNPTTSGVLDAASPPASPAAGTTLATTITSTGTTVFLDAGVLPGIQYNYTLIPFNNDGVVNAQTYNYFLTGAPSANAATWSLEPTAHAASFTATTGGTNQINLAFSAANTLPNAFGYIILRRQDGTFPTSVGVNDGVAPASLPLTAGTTLITNVVSLATTSFNDATASPAILYTYAIIPYGYNGSNSGTYNYRTAATIPTSSNYTLSLEPTAHPAAFTAATGSTSQINLTFSPASSIPNAAGYIILRRQDLTDPTIVGITDGLATSATPTAGTTLVTTITNTATTSFNDTGLTPGTQYNYSIIPYGYDGTHAATYNYRTAVTVKTANAFTLSLEPLAHAASFTAAATTTTQINLTFSAASTLTNAAGYIILRRQDGVNPDATGIVDGVAAPPTPVAGTTLVTTIASTVTTSFNDVVSPGTKYNYILIPYGGSGSSINYLTTPVIPAANATTLSLEPLTQPASFIATTASPTQIDLSFSAASSITNAAGYIILRRQDATNPTTTGIADGAAAPGTPVAGTTLVTTIASTATTTFSDTGLTPGTQYNYAILAYGYNGSNALTYNFLTVAGFKTANAFTLSLEPTAQAALFTAVQAGTTQINLTFSAASSVSAAGYIILKRTDGTNPTTTGIADGVAAPSSPATGTTLLTTITSSATTTFSDTGLSPGAVYNYAIIPYGYNGTNAATYNYRTLATVPTASTFTLSLEPIAHAASFTATQSGTSQINLAFSAANTLTNAAGYIILRRSDGVNPTATGIVDGAAVSATPTTGTTLVTTITSTATTSYADTGLSSGITYNYAIIPFGYNGTNALTYNYRTAATIPTAAATTVVVEPSAQPTALTFTSLTPTGFTANFTASVGTAAGYIAFRKSGSSPTTAVPVDGTTYTPGATLGDGTVAYIGTSTSFSESALAISTVYFYDIFAFNGAGPTINYLAIGQLEGSQSTLANAATTQATNLLLPNGSIGNNQVVLNWTNGNGARRIVLAHAGASVDASPVNGTTYSANVAFGSGSQVGTGNYVVFDGTGNTVTVTGLSASTTYGFQVFEYNGTGADNNFNNATATGNPASVLTRPDAPVANAATSVTATSMLVSWSAVNGSTGYFVDVSTDNFSTFVGTYNGQAVAGTSLTITGLTGGSTYQYQVRASNATGASTNSNVISQLTLPAVPVAIAASAVAQTSFTANWNAVASATDYFVDVASDAGFTNIITGFNNKQVTGATSLQVIGLTAGTLYYYQVRAKNTTGTTVSSNAINQITIPSKPLNFKTTSSTSSGFVVQWDPVTGASGYQLDVQDPGTLNFITGYNAKALVSNFTQVTGLLPNTLYVVTVRATNAGGVSPNSDQLPVLTADAVGSGGGQLVAPVIGITNTTTPNAVKATITANTGFNNTITFYHRKITEATFTSAAAVTGNTLEATYVPATDFDALGMEYYFEAKDQFNQKGTTDHAFIYAPITAKAIPELKTGGTLQSYQIFSVPLKLDNVAISSVFQEVEAQYAGYDKTKWRLVHYQNGRNVDYKEGLNDIQQGKGYWFNSADAVSVKVSGTTIPANQLVDFSLSLDAGWNQVGNPFPFEISWNDVLLKNPSVTGVGKIFRYDAASVSFKEAAGLNAWEGGFVKADQATTIKIPVTVKQSASGRVGAPAITTADLSKPEWMIPLTLKQGSAFNELGGIGMHPDALPGNDKFDQQSLPRFIKFLEMNSYHDDYFIPRFARDVVPTQNHYNWEFVVESNFDTPTISLSWDNTSMGHNDAQLLLFDVASNVVVDMKRNSQYEFESGGKRVLKLFYGADEKSILPDITGLGRPYPNPATTQVAFPFITGTGNEEVQIAVYDLMGKRLRVVVRDVFEPGLHVANWDGTDDTGSRVAQGIYVYRLEMSGRSSQQGRVVMK
ncbi:MAG TPA: fibronectin type III domain-containing protein [Cyclobacteriaceae bacterium]|nr:fibronectin type III domain-containing protein [Cyclobacteriaceae bacterium]